MAVVEHILSRRWKVGQIPSVELTFSVIDVASDAVALQQVAATAPPSYGSMIRKDIELEPQGHGVWLARVTYQGLESEDFGLIAVDFSVGTESVKILEGYETTAYAPPGRVAPDFGNAINVTDDGVEGVEILVPTLEWSETWRHPDESINGVAYAGQIYALVGTTNAYRFRGFSRGEVLFRGVSGRKTRQDAWEFTYSFAASPNVTNLTVGGITGIAKKGWEYLWAYYRPQEDNEAKALVQRPVAVYVTRVYRESNFSRIGIGS